MNIRKNESNLDFFVAEMGSATKGLANIQLPDPYLMDYYRYNMDRKIWLDEEIGDNTIDIVRRIILWNIEDEDGSVSVENRKPIFLYIMSPGGDSDYMWSLVDTILASETPVITVNMGQCASAAGIIFMSGHRRLMMKNATVMIHEGSAVFNGDSTKVIDASENYKVMLRKLHNYILSRTSIPDRALKSKKSNDWELDAEKCMQYGVCDCIIDKLSEII